MVNYECYRCGYTNINKTKIINHINRKLRCKPNKCNIDLDECKEYIINGLSYNEYLNLDKNPANHCKNHNIPTNNHNISQQTTNIKCKYCDKTYSRIDSLNHPDYIFIDSNSKCSDASCCKDSNSSVIKNCVINENIISSIKFNALFGNYKVMVINEADKLSKISYESLLKTLEEVNGNSDKVKEILLSFIQMRNN